MNHTPTTLALPALPRDYRWEVTSTPGGTSSLALIRLQRRRYWRWRTVDFSYVHPNPRDEAHSPARIAAAMLAGQQARRVARLA